MDWMGNCGGQGVSARSDVHGSCTQNSRELLRMSCLEMLGDGLDG
jgi:hypothetical protein